MKKIIFFILLPVLAFSQKINNNVNYYITEINEPIIIDGNPKDAAWQNIKVADNFTEVLPSDSIPAIVKSEVKMCYDQNNIYLLFINYKKDNAPVMVESLKRDFNFGSNDNDLLFIDTFNDQTTGFSFGSNAKGAQWDGLMFNGSNIDLSWENKWQSEVYNDDEKWVWEAAIPFKTLRYNPEVLKWGLQFSRLDLKQSEKSAWAPVPRMFSTSTLAYTGNLIWDKPLPIAKSKVTLIPYISAGLQNDPENNNGPSFFKGIGGDAKIAVNSSLNLDLTINPDFSQVEVDVQQTNLDRFELFFPERRQFFIENGDIFNGFGNSNLRPFFSRRIGLNAPIFYGARLSGKLNENWRIGAMNTQTGRSNDNAPGANYTVFSLQKKILARSYVSAMLTNKSLHLNETDTGLEDSKFNRTLSLQYNLASKDNKWTGNLLYLKSFSPIKYTRSDAYSLNMGRSTKKFNVEIDLESVGQNLSGNDIGYIQRTNYNLASFSAGPIFIPKSGKIANHGPMLMARAYTTRESLKKTESLLFLRYGIDFKDRSQFVAWVAKDYVKLRNPFDPTNFVGETLAANTEHIWHAFGLEYESKPQQLFTYALATRLGGYYASGKRYSGTTEIGYRFQPYLALKLNTNFNAISFNDNALLPETMKNQHYYLWLVGPKIDLTLTNKLFFTNYVQFNNQNNNINLNSRLQWRYKPASDLFLVYTDNYFADNLNLRNRAIVLKFNYWWNL